MWEDLGCDGEISSNAVADGMGQWTLTFWDVTQP